MRKPTRLEDERVLKRMGVLLNSPVEDRTFSKEYETHWKKQLKAHYNFMKAIYDFIDGNEEAALSLRQQLILLRKFKVLRREVRRCGTFITKRMDGDPADQKTQQVQVMDYFVRERAIPFINYWEDVFHAAEHGVAVDTVIAVKWNFLFVCVVLA
jgi:hypothetical protein